MGAIYGSKNGPHVRAIMGHTWELYMEVRMGAIHGSYTWKLYTGAIHGSHTWKQEWEPYTGAIHGSHTWKQEWAIHGSYTREPYMEAIYGSKNGPYMEARMGHM